ncbi:hypothetical protein APHAL10511_005696 [Amanita phalloides]|nr:hypothetical protein APHAL10511_005696 [Amanita phalloides]
MPAHPIRITTNTKFRPCVCFALDWFEKNAEAPIVFHTLPPDKKEPTTEADDATSRKQPSATTHITSNIPRLISMVEIIKREFLRNLNIHRSPRLAGLHQYTEIGCFEDLQNPTVETTLPPREEPDSENALEKRAKEVAQALSGKNYVRRTRTPYMKITLSLDPVPSLVEQGASYQPPTTRKISKSAKLRAKKRKRRAAEDLDNSGQEMSE